MLPRNHVTSSKHILQTNHLLNSSFTHPSIDITKTYYHQTKEEKHQLSPLRSRYTTIKAVTRRSTIATRAIYSVNTLTSTSSRSISNSSTHQQQVSFEETYSPKTGIKTAALLGGMLILVIIYLLWKARARLCRPHRSSTGTMNNGRLSATKFDLDYWLKQVDLLEAKEAERHRGGQTLYLELPKQEPRDSRQATASWIVDAYRQWRLLQYRRQEHLFRSSTGPSQSESSPKPYRRRRHLMRRFFRRYFSSSRHNHSLFAEHTSSLFAGMRPSIVSNTINVSPLLMADVPLRRANSWPHIRTSRHSAGASMSALQTHLARNRLLKRHSRPTLEI